MAAHGFLQRTGWVAALAIACNTFVLIVVNYAIYWARATYIARYPEEVALKPPTISGAIADPSIGDPFSFWVTVAAVVLFVGVVALSALLLNALPPEARRLRGLVWAIVVMQIATCTGMVMLSQYRFPDHNDMHMLGSYIAFLAEVVVVILQWILSVAVLRHVAASRALTRASLLHRGANRMRRVFAMLCVATAAVFGILFILKDYVDGVVKDIVFVVYVNSEPTFITLTLVVLATYNIDMAMSLRKPAAAQAARVS